MMSDLFYDLPPVRCYCGEVLGNKYDRFVSLITGNTPNVPRNIAPIELNQLVTEAIQYLTLKNDSVLFDKDLKTLSRETQKEVKEFQKRLDEAGVYERNLGQLTRLQKDIETRLLLDQTGPMTPEQAFDYLGLRSPCCRAHLSNPGRLAYGGDVEIPELETAKPARTRSTAASSSSNPVVVLNVPIRKTLVRTSRVPPRITREKTEERRKAALERGEEFKEREFTDI